mgnify:CR=1 FL=1
MKVRAWLQKSGATPGKLALVGCLAVCLVFVLCNQQYDDVSQTTLLNDSPHVEADQPTTSDETASIAAKSQAVQTQEKKEQQWPNLVLEEVIANDPFAMPNWFHAALVSKPTDSTVPVMQADQFEPLSNERTKIVVISNNNRVATIGKDNYRVGDTIEGFQITEIDLNGVVIEGID